MVRSTTLALLSFLDGTPDLSLDSLGVVYVPGLVCLVSRSLDRTRAMMMLMDLSPGMTSAEAADLVDAAWSEEMVS